MKKSCTWCGKSFQPSGPQKFCSTRCQLNSHNKQERAWRAAHRDEDRKAGRAKYRRMKKNPRRWAAFLQYQNSYYHARMEVDPAFRKRRRKLCKLSDLRCTLRRLGVPEETLR